MKKKYDIIFAGFGFANAILAYRLRLLRPKLSFLVVDEKESLTGEEYTWSFFSSDLDSPQMQWVSPLIAHHWEDSYISFPRFSKYMGNGYNSIAAESLYRQLLKDPLSDFIIGKKVTGLSAYTVLLENGSRYEGGCVFDGRGLRQPLRFKCGYQKFVGLDITLSRPHGLKHPIIIDCNLPQIDGFRLMYALPWSDRSMMIEDTRYGMTPDIDREECIHEILHYAESKGWKVSDTGRTETGATPVPLESDPDYKADIRRGIPLTGMRAGLVHPTTGYAVPYAIQLADIIAAQPVLDSKQISGIIAQVTKSLLPPMSPFYLLNTLFLRMAPPEYCYKFIEKFYENDPALVRRFFSGKVSYSDMIRIFAVKSPVNPLLMLKSFVSSVKKY